MKLSAALCVLLLATTLQAQWAEDGISLSPGSTSAGGQVLLPDGEGGVFFFHYYTGPGLTAARYDRHGRELWSVEVPRYGLMSYVYGTQALPDGVGGYWLAYYGMNGAVQTTVVNRIDAEGALQFGDGVAVNGTTPAIHPQLVVTDDGNLGLVWQTNSTSTSDIYAQKVDPNGALLWAANGVVVCTATGEQTDPCVVVDGYGGLIVCWADDRMGNWDIYAQRVVPAGLAGWAANGVALCSDPSNQTWLTACSDDNGGMIAGWTDNRSGYAVYAQRVNVSSSMLWTTNGIVVAASTASAGYLVCERDGAGGAVVAWCGERAGIDGIYAQHFNGLGLTLWTADGIHVSDDISTIRDLSMAVGHDTVVHYAWEDNRGGDYDVRRQRTDAAGAYELGIGGTPVVTQSSNQDNPALCVDDGGAVFVCWEDDRDAAEETWIQRFEPTDAWGFSGAMMHGAADVPDDQGGFVNLAWHASRLDAYPTMGVSSYTVWRSLIADKAGVGATVLRTPDQWSPDLKGRVVLASADKSYFWELIDTVAPYGISGYGRIVATPYDSMSVATPPIHYMVITHTDAPETFWLSSPVSALSVDDLAPSVPLGLAGAASYTPVGLDITWLDNPEDDIAHYVLYRGDEPGFVPGAGNLVATVDATLFLDTGWVAGDYYRLTAVDVHGNEGPSALLAPESVTAIGDTPRATVLEQNVPNPFNPSTTVFFALAADGPVTVDVYDAAGRRVAVLVDGHLTAGRHQVLWDGCDDQGRMSPTGVYLYRLEAGDVVSSKRMLLIK